MKPLTLLITSVGSFLGHNILESLAQGRRQIRVIGANYDADNPRMFRCDRAYLVPKVDEVEAFGRRLMEIIERESPDMIFPGRDHDVVALARLREEHPELASRIPCGSPDLAEMMQDKLLTDQFAKARGVPFADTIAATDGDSLVQQFVARHGYPLIAKPRRGYGSLGVRVISESAQLEPLLRYRDYVLQPFIDPPPQLSQMFPDLSAGTPLFFGLPDDRQFAGQTVIDPSGNAAEFCCTVNRRVMGRADRCERADDLQLAQVMRQWTDAVAAAGWRGSFNLQCRQLADGSYVAFELNGRMSGSTSARSYLGFNEPKILVERFLGPDAWPEESADASIPGFVSRSLTDGFVADSDVDSLRTNGVWTASS